MAALKVYHWRRYVNARKIQRMAHSRQAIRAARHILREKRALHAKKMIAIVPIQCCARIFIATRYVDRHRQAGIVKWFLREVKSRGLVGRALTNYRLRKRESDRRLKASTMIQALVRGVQGRKQFKRRYKKLKQMKVIRDNNKGIRAAIKIQSIMRRYLAIKVAMKRRIIIMEQERQLAEIEAIDGQLDAMHEDWMGDLMAISIQTGVRGMIASK